MFIRLEGECCSSKPKQRQEEENRVRIGSIRTEQEKHKLTSSSLSNKVQASLWKMLWKYRLQTRLADSRKMLHLCKPQNRSAAIHMLSCSLCSKNL